MARNPWLHLLCLVAFSSTVQRPAGGTEPDSRWLPEKVLASAKLSDQAHLLVAPVTIDGKEYRFIINTDHYYSHLDTKIAADLRPLKFSELGYTDEDLKREGIAVAATADAPLLRAAPELKIGNHRCELKAVVPSYVSQYSKDAGFDVHGMLGMDVLHQLVLHIDLENDVLMICAPNAEQRPPGKSTHLHLNGSKIAYVKVTFASQFSEPFKIDTSYVDDGEFSENVFNQLGLNDAARVIDQQPTEDDNGEQAVEEFFQLAEISVAGVASKRQTLLRGKENRLSVDFLLRHRTTFDFKSERMYVETTRFSHFERPDAKNGFTLDLEDERVAIKTVQPMSVAEKVGLKPGDVVTSIGGASTQKGLLWKRAFAVPSDNPLVLEIVRDGEQLKIELPRQTAANATLPAETSSPQDSQAMAEKDSQSR